MKNSKSKNSSVKGATSIDQLQILQIELLPEVIKKRGAYYHQIKRGNRSFIYKRSDGIGPDSYEIFKLKKAPPVNYRGMQKSARERFPHDEAFGNWAWSSYTLERAYKIFNNLENNRAALAGL